MKAIQTTPNSWLINSENGLVGLLCRLEDQYRVYTPFEIMVFESKEELTRHYRGLSFEAEREPLNKQKIQYLGEYPVKHSDIQIVEEGNVPLYTKGGNAVYCAGFWAIKFTNGWTQAYCPKVSTVTENESEGPFKNKLELLSRINVLNKGI